MISLAQMRTFHQSWTPILTFSLVFWLLAAPVRGGENTRIVLLCTQYGFQSVVQSGEGTEGVNASRHCPLCLSADFQTPNTPVNFWFQALGDADSTERAEIVNTFQRQHDFYLPLKRAPPVIVAST